MAPLPLSTAVSEKSPPKAQAARREQLGVDVLGSGEGTKPFSEIPKVVPALRGTRATPKSLFPKESGSR